ncbi:Outer membrane porin F [Phycisphaerales bacterium]|nr:Outer membrane porin F [Phycisphaerales bacterium]
MADGNGTILSADGGGILGSNDPKPVVKLPVAPTHEQEHNTIRPGIIPVGCWKADDVNFDFDSSFVRPGVANQTPRFKTLLDQNPGAAVSLFGHADPVGNDDYNKALSGRRAKAMYAMLIREPKMWEELFGAGDLKMAHVQVMLRHLGFDPGRTDGTTDQGHKDAVKLFQENNDLANDGVAGPDTRKKIYLVYMDAVCVDDAGKPFKVAKADFLGAGKDSGGKADFQGCGEFNPLLLFSKSENAALESKADKTDRNLANAPNRRVLILLFKPGTKVDPARWPCPRAAEGTAGCKKRFWSDADTRKQLTDQHREHQKTKDTFQCRFYQRLTDSSPCERATAFIVARLYDHNGDFIGGSPFTLTLANGKVFHDVADARGFATLPERPDDVKGVMEWKTVPPKDVAVEVITFKQDIFFNLDKDDDESIRKRLTNLGYTSQKDLAAAVKAFHEDYHEEEDLDADGALGPKTRAVIVRVHSDLKDKIRTDSDDT